MFAGDVVLLRCQLLAPGGIALRDLGGTEVLLHGSVLLLGAARGACRYAVAHDASGTEWFTCHASDMVQLALYTGNCCQLNVFRCIHLINAVSILLRFGLSRKRA
jgi:hypothetical protein